jgi:hypothetical protein
VVERHIAVEDLAKTVKVEIITTSECSLTIEATNGRLQITAPSRVEAA